MAKQKKVKEKQIKQPVQTEGDPKPTCPTGYYWNGTRCVKDVG